MHKNMIIGLLVAAPLALGTITIVVNVFHDEPTPEAAAIKELEEAFKDAKDEGIGEWQPGSKPDNLRHRGF